MSCARRQVRARPRDHGSRICRQTIEERASVKGIIAAIE